MPLQTGPIRAGGEFVLLPGVVQGEAASPLHYGLEEEVQAMRGMSLHTYAGDRRGVIYPYMLR